LLQQNPPILNLGCQLTQVDLYNGHKRICTVLPSLVAPVIDNNATIVFDTCKHST